jgi:hypothetical protein
MFGIRFIKSQPTVHLMQFRAGKVVREGSGQSFYYYAVASEPAQDLRDRVAKPLLCD